MDPWDVSPKSRLRRWGPWGVVAAVAVIWSFSLARHNYALHAFEYAGSWALHDEGAQALTPLLIVRGKVPYRDFEPRHTPLSYYVFAAGFWVLGRDLYSLRLVLAGANVATALFAYGWARRAGAGRWAWMAPLAALMWGVHEYNVAVPRWLAVPASLVASLLLVREAPSPRLRWIAAAGVAYGVTVLLAQNTGVFAGAAAVWALCVWATRESDAVRTVRAQARNILPLLATGVTAAALAQIVYLRGPSVPWLLYSLPGFGVTLALAVRLWRRPLSTTGLRRLAAQLTVLGAAAAVPVGIGFGWWIWRGGWGPVARSLRAGAGSLARIYALEPPAPPVWIVLCILAWGCAGFGLLGGIKGTTASVRRLTFIVAMLLAGAVVLGLMWFPLASASATTAGQVVVSIADRLVTETFIHLLWLLGAAGAVLAVATFFTSGSGRAQASAVLAAFTTLTSWLHLHPWADYTHVLWTAPFAGVVAAFVFRRIDERVSELWGERAHPRMLRWALISAALLVPAMLAVGMGIKWATYWLEYQAALSHGRLIGRQFALFDRQHGAVWVSPATQADWGGLLSYVRSRTSPNTPVIGLPYLPLVNVLADRPFPLYDCFWWPDFTGEVRTRQETDVARALRARVAPVVVGPVTDDTYFSLPVMRETWPTAWTALTEEYERTRVVGPFWVFEPAGSASTQG